ncbi:adaptor protein MecA [Lacticaseibacillus sharpeae]|uniref:Adapter protein MecA n=1 Tax=Lacticaseibacillus sharpeae JCM 1186 = DSM 20505 TaxID=1291052 RepID=A0A0R1ZNG0_9LACO|nr:adaptor protein MecA [Lacticaseibacillus sharpeae]KRM56567.1 adaptor protein [Lacticaseibacillus sharpeae JCM 1186 = DSM 20505]
MEMERINDDTIRIFMNTQELKDRGIQLVDLVANHKRIEKFFYGVLDEVDSDHTFAENGAVTFQVMPSGSGLEIFISKSSNDEADLDATDDANPAADAPTDKFSQLARETLQRFTDGKKDADAKTEAEDDVDFFADGDSVALTLQLPDFEAMVNLARELRMEGGVSDLYKFRNAYFLVLRFYSNMVSESEAQVQMSIASEYGFATNVTPETLVEHGQHVMETSALETTRYYFK